jgi:hypothetical protein
VVVLLVRSSMYSTTMNIKMLSLSIYIKETVLMRERERLRTVCINIFNPMGGTYPVVIANVLHTNVSIYVQYALTSLIPRWVGFLLSFPVLLEYVVVCTVLLRT